VVSVVVGAIGASAAELKMHLENTLGDQTAESLMKPALLGSAYIPCGRPLISQEAGRVPMSR
jgi:hypothetical protein